MSRVRRYRLLWALAAASVLLLAAGLAAGGDVWSLARLWQLLQWPDAALIVGQIRAPRTLGAWLTGALLGLSGAVAQGLFRNPLADPYLLGTSGGQFLGNGYFGKGVEIEGVSRAYDSYLTREAQLTRSVAAGDEARYARLKQLESLFPLGETSLGVTLNNALNAWSAVATSPTDTTARTVVIARAEELTARLRDVTAIIAAVGTEYDAPVETIRTDVQEFLQEMVDANLLVVVPDS